MGRAQGLWLAKETEIALHGKQHILWEHIVFAKYEADKYLPCQGSKPAFKYGALVSPQHDHLTNHESLDLREPSTLCVTIGLQIQASTYRYQGIHII